MSKLIGLSFLAIIPIEIALGLSGLFLIEAAIAVILLGGSFSFLNYKGMLPGTTTYESRVALERAQSSLELDRVNRMRTRIRLLESEDVDRILALGPASEES